MLRLDLRMWLVLAVACAISGLAFSGQAADSAPTPTQAWQRLKEGNERFAADRLGATEVDAARRHELTAGQHPFAIVLSCADSRVPPEILFNQGLGNLFVVRVAGNVSEPFAMGSIDYAVDHLHVPLIVVLGHAECGAVKAALGDHLPAGNLGKLLQEIHVGEHPSADKATALASSVESNVRYQAQHLVEQSAVVRAGLAQKQLQVVRGVYNLDSGKVRWLESP